MKTIVIFLAVVVFSVLAIAFGTRAMASLVPGRVTSWWRSPWKNAAVQGHPGSLHLIGWAVDFTPVTEEVEAQARTLFPHVVNEGDHIHAAMFKA